MTRKVDNALSALMKLSDADREHMRRILTGDADNDRIRVGDLIEALRDLRTNPCPSREYQRALSDVSRLAYRLATLTAGAAA